MKDNQKSASSSSQSREVEIDVKVLLMPLALIISALIISIPLSLSIYFGLRDAGIGGGNVAGVALAAECDEASPLSKNCLVKYADDADLDTEEFAQCLDNKEFDDVVADEIAYGSEIGIQGTPSLYIGEDKGESMRGFSMGAGVAISDVETLIDLIEDKGIDAAAKEWKKRQTDGLASYETQLRDYYSGQGQAGDALKNSVATGLQQRKAEIDESVKVTDIEYGEGVVKGDKNAKVTIMEFSDYECPYCKSYAAGVGKSIDEQFIQEGKAMFIYRDFPLESIHPNARRAANAARCAYGQGEEESYFKYHDVLFGISE